MGNRQFLIKSFPLILLPIILLGAFLRLFRITSNPPGLYWDEASIGYNAVSISQTLKDEHGVFLPFWFKAFGEYKLPVYIYLTSIIILFFGYSDFIVRLPSALAGIASIWLIHRLVLLLNITPDKSTNRRLACLAAFFFAISPWSIHFSRAGFEANLALVFILAAITLFLQGLQNHPRRLILSSLFFLLSILTYNSARLFVPLLLVCLRIIFASDINLHRSAVNKAILIGLLVFLPFLPAQLDSRGWKRASEAGYLNFHRPLASLTRLKNEYLKNFDTNYLFFYGDQTGRHSTRFLGMLYYYDLPLVVIGLYHLITQTPSAPRNLILAWLLLGPLPAALSETNPHALRSLNALPAWILISSLGASYVITYILKKYKTKRFILYSLFIILTGIVLYNHLIFHYEYWLHFPKATAPDWSNGFKQTIVAFKDKRDQYSHIYISDKIPLPYLGLYLPIPPSEYHQIDHKYTDVYPRYQNITFFYEAWTLPPPAAGTDLIVAPAWQKPGEETDFRSINMVNGDALFNIWERHADS